MGGRRSGTHMQPLLLCTLACRRLGMRVCGASRRLQECVGLQLRLLATCVRCKRMPRSERMRVSAVSACTREFVAESSTCTRRSLCAGYRATVHARATRNKARLVIGVRYNKTQLNQMHRSISTWLCPVFRGRSQARVRPISAVPLPRFWPLSTRFCQFPRPEPRAPRAGSSHNTPRTARQVYQPTGR